MENTGKILFEDDQSQWYVALGDRWAGPLSASEVYEKVIQQEISWAHYVWKPGQQEWKRICDIKTFQAAVPAQPQQKFMDEVKEAAKPLVKQVTSRRGSSPSLAEEAYWFLYYNDTQFGPFSEEEVTRALKGGRITDRVYGWKDGMGEWKKLQDLPEFQLLPPSPPKSSVRPPSPPKGAAKATAPEKEEHRKAPRTPLVAKIVMAHEDKIHVGVCRDISVGGLQILTDRLPSPVGSKIKINVSADGIIQAFSAEGTVVRLLEDRRGFSFRFEKISEEARRAIENYLHAAGV